MKKRTITIKHGEALVTKPHPDPLRRRWGDRVNVRFKFVGCRPDPKDPGRTLFDFDVHCDGKDIQTARWKGGLQGTRLPAARTKETRKIDRGWILRKPGWRDRRETIVRVAPQRGPIFEQRKGTLEATDEGLEYLRNNYRELLKGAYTSEYEAPDGTRGLRVTNIAAASRAAATQFGLVAGDVILSVNGHPVASKTAAVNVVKRELRNKVRMIEMKILRLGRTKTARFDARDPETRRRARAALRDR